jgi:hypothetical protein
MSMNATFVQVDPAELARFQADPSSVESLFGNDPVTPPQFLALSKTMQDRVRTRGPQMFAGALAQLDPALRQQIEQSIGRTAQAFASGGGGDDLLKLMQERMARRAGPAPSNGGRAVLSLDKHWHGVHYVLCGEVEPGPALLSQAVLGGTPLGDDDEGFSGYGPARYFTAPQVANISAALSHPEVESEAAARFDAARMSQLDIYPGWRPSDAKPIAEDLRRLRDFYAEASSRGCAIVTCLV